MSLPQPLPVVPATEDIVPAMRRIINEYNIVRTQILQTVTSNTAVFENVMLPLAQVENAVQGTFAMIDMLQYGSPSLATQEAFNEARELYAKAQASWISNEAFFRLLQAARDKDSFHQLDTESRHLMEKELLRYKYAGHGLLEPFQLEEYQKRNADILQLEREFQQNVAKENGGLWFPLDELDGIPENELAKWRSSFEEEGLVNGTHEKTFVPFSNGGTLAVLTYAHRSGTRKKMFLADNLKLEENKSVFEKIIVNRAKQAHLLKYPTHAVFKLEERMVQTTAWLEQFLDGLQTALCPRGKAEIELLQRRRQEDMGAKDNGSDLELNQGFPPWDKRYYERLVEQEFEIDQLKIAEFFPLEKTATNMLDIFASLLGLRFDPISSDMLSEDVIWHDTVRAFSVWDTKNDDFIGYLYLDLLWREYKFRGNQDVNIQGVSATLLLYLFPLHPLGTSFLLMDIIQGFLRPDGTRQCPANILMCSFPTPIPGTCALLKHHQIVTLFHGKHVHEVLLVHNPPDNIIVQKWAMVFTTF